MTVGCTGGGGSIGDIGCVMLGCEQGANMSPIDETGILIKGFVGPIPYGCQTVSKTQIEEAIGDFVECRF
jgi:hypothetical protein